MEDSLDAFETCEYEWIIRDFNINLNNRSPDFESKRQKCKWEISVVHAGPDLFSDFKVRIEPRNITNNYFTKISVQLLNSNDLIIYEGLLRHVYRPSVFIGCELKVPKYTVLSFIDTDTILKIRVNILAELLTTKLPKLDTMIVQKEKIPPTKLARHLESMFKNGALSDFVIKTSDGGEIKVHRSILAARSPVFAGMFTHDTSEQNVRYVEIQDIEKGTMYRLLNFVYTESVETLSENDAQQLLIAAEKYQIEDLKNHCSENLMPHINDKNVLNTLALAHLHNVPELKRVAINYYLKNIKKFSSTDMFKEIKPYSDLLIELLCEIPKLLD